MYHQIKGYTYLSIFILCALFFTQYACSNRGIAEHGYSETPTGLFFRLEEVGEGKKPELGDFLQLRISYKTELDSLFFDGYSNNESGMVFLPYNHSSYRGSFEEGLVDMNEGDSVSFIVKGDSLFKYFFKTPTPYFIRKGSYVKVFVKLNKIYTVKEYEDLLKKYESAKEDKDIQEAQKIKQYTDTAKPTFTKFSNGIYYTVLQEGKGDSVKRGDFLQLQYKGYFLNGKIFESTYYTGQPFEFTYGEQGQVIKGFEMVLNKMKEGEKTKFVIPSQFAYGDSGSSSGIIPSYTTVIYEIELLKINKNKANTNEKTKH